MKSKSSWFWYRGPGSANHQFLGARLPVHQLLAEHSGFILKPHLGIHSWRIYIEEQQLRALLQSIQDNRVDIGQAVNLLRDLPYQDLGFAKLDHHRPLRTGFPEVVLGKGKTPEQISQIVFALKGRGYPVLVTKTDSAAYQSVLQRVPEAIFNELAGAIVVEESVPRPKFPGVLVISATKRDLAAAEEAVLTAELMGK